MARLKAKLAPVWTALALFALISGYATYDTLDRRQAADSRKHELCLQDQRIRNAQITLARTNAESLVQAARNGAVRDGATPAALASLEARGAEYVQLQVRRAEERVPPVEC